MMDMHAFEQSAMRQPDALSESRLCRSTNEQRCRTHRSSGTAL